MTLRLGLDTGGTYTDAVLFEEAEAGTGRVLAKAKALTTRHDLAIGIGEAMDAVFAAARDAEAGDVALVSLSTTLATNALVEGQGGRVCLVYIGFGESELDRAGLRQALSGDPVIMLDGGHGPHGEPRAPLDLARLEAILQGSPPAVEGFAVAAQFAVRNPEHEIAARDSIIAATGRPVTCSHELSSKLGGPKRALTCVLNARLIGLLHRLIGATQALLAQRGLDASLMVVRGDGALVSAEFARTRPIETILSGPAASVVGAAYLTGVADAVVSDIGGTTTDIAVLKDGRPRLDQEGASVGGWRTMVEAIAVRTHGLGGDSEVSVREDGLARPIVLGPRRVMPVSLLAMDHCELVHRTLARQIEDGLPRQLEGRFAVPLLRNAPTANLSAAEQQLMAALAAGPLPLDRLVSSRALGQALARLVRRGCLMIAALTPSDCAHVLGLHDAWDAEAAHKAASLFACRRDGRGVAIAQDAAALAASVLHALERRSAEVLIDAAFAEDGFPHAEPSRHPLAAAALDGMNGLARVDLALTAPLIGLGASAPAYYPRIAQMLATQAIIPEHADVANAIGAVVGRVRLKLSAIVSQPSAGRFRAHLDGAPEDFADVEQAVGRASDWLQQTVHEQAQRAGAERIDVTIEREDVTATVEGEAIFVETRLRATATGQPRLRLQ